MSRAFFVRKVVNPVRVLYYSFVPYRAFFRFVGGVVLCIMHPSLPLCPTFNILFFIVSILHTCLPKTFNFLPYVCPVCLLRHVCIPSRPRWYTPVIHPHSRINCAMPSHYMPPRHSLLSQIPLPFPTDDCFSLASPRPGLQPGAYFVLL